MYGLAAAGLLVVYRATRHLDLSQGAAATAAAFTMHRLRTDLAVPTPAAIAAGLVTAAAVGAVNAVIIRRVGPQRPLAALVAGIALAGLVLAGCAAVFGLQTQFMPPLLSGAPVRLAGTVLSAQQLLVMATAAVTVVAGSLILRRSWVGLAWTGLAGERRGAQTVGLPVARLETASYVAGAVLAGAAGILVAPLLFLDTAQMTVFFLVKPFAAAVAAGLVSLPAAFGAGIAIGVAESALVGVRAVPGLGETVPFLVVATALGIGPRLARRRGAGLRETPGPALATGPSRTPGHGRLWPALLVTAVLLFGGPHLGPYWATIAQLGGITAIVAAGHVVFTGWTGQLSLATPALAGIGAVTAARSATGLHLPFPIPLLAGAGAGAAAAAVVGLLLARRSGGALFAAGTLAFGAACSGALFALPGFVGTTTARTLPAVEFGGVLLSGPRYTAVVAAAAGLAFAGLWRLGRSRLGAAMAAVREHERAAVALGIPAGRIRWTAFVLTGGLSGLAGALTAFQLRSVSLEPFHPLTALPVLSAAVIGGIESLWGAVIGAALLTAGPELLRHLSAPILAGAVPPAVLVVIVAFRPGGLASLVKPRVRPPAPRPFPDGGSATGATAADGGLRIDDLTVLLGRFRAVDGMTLAVGGGEVVALIGPNGAGKTTILDAVSGFVTPTGGSIRLEGLRLDGAPPAGRLKMGCGRTFQSGGLFPRLSLRDNVDVPRRWHRLAGPPADELLAAAGIDSADAEAAAVPPGTARRAEIARILALRPALLLLDEPTAGLGRSESDALMQLIRTTAGSAAILVVEHDLRVVAGTDRVVVMDAGRLLAAGRFDDVRSDPEVIAAYLGSVAAPSNADSHPGPRRLGAVRAGTRTGGGTTPQEEAACERNRPPPGL